MKAKQKRNLLCRKNCTDRDFHENIEVPQVLTGTLDYKSSVDLGFFSDMANKIIIKMFPPLILNISFWSFPVPLMITDKKQLEEYLCSMYSGRTKLRAITHLRCKWDLQFEHVNTVVKFEMKVNPHIENILI